MPWDKTEDDLHSALCQFCNEAGDPYEPVSDWNDGVEDAFRGLSKAYNAWYSWMLKTKGEPPEIET